MTVTKRRATEAAKTILLTSFNYSREHQACQMHFKRDDIGCLFCKASEWANGYLGGL